jgi:hypothetical protein
MPGKKTFDITLSAGFGQYPLGTEPCAAKLPVPSDGEAPVLEPRNEATGWALIFVGVTPLDEVC